MLILFAASFAARAEEISVALGRLHAIGGKEVTYSWQIQYLHHFRPNWAGSLTWLNEGHLPDHHRDGALFQAWRFHRMEKNDLCLGIGLGVYRTFDTTGENDAEGSYRNRHGVRPLLSLRTQYPLGGGWAFVQLNRTLGCNAPQTQAILIGGITRFETASSFGRATHRRGDERVSPEPWNGLTFYFGRTILNSFESETSEALEAFSLEYRRRLTRYVDATLSYCDEGGIDSVRRDGVVPQLWVSRRSPKGWLLSFGAGPYFSRLFPEKNSESPRSKVTVHTSFRYSMLVGRQLWGHWGGRLQWNRTLTRYHRDTDVLQIGIAYQW